MKLHGRTFYFASLFLAKEQAKRAELLYGLCREIDDIADLSADREQARHFLEQLRSALRKRDCSHPLVAIALELQPELIPEPLDELLLGVLSDLDSVRIKNESELQRYCYQVAGTVGLMMCGVLSVTNPRATGHAADLGIAMQLTNIARDVVEDAKNDRRYLPRSLVGEIDPVSIVAPDTVQKSCLQAAVKQILFKASNLYDSGLAGLPFLPFRARFSILVAAMSYRQIGDLLAERDYDLWSGRISTTRWQKIRIALRALFIFLTRSEIHSYRDKIAS